MARAYLAELSSIAFPPELQADAHEVIRAWGRAEALWRASLGHRDRVEQQVHVGRRQPLHRRRAPAGGAGNRPRGPTPQGLA